MTTIPYRIRRSPRARHARIVVDGGGVEVVVPNGFALRKVEPFVNEKRPWIERTLRRLHESAAEVGTASVEDGGEVPYLGERLRLRVSTDPGRTRDWVSRRGDELHVAVGGGPDSARQAI